MLRIQCPRCPLCDSPPVLGLTLILPWFCSTESCLVLAWDPFETLEANLMDAAPITETERQAFFDGPEDP